MRWPSTSSTWKTIAVVRDLVARLGGAVERAEDEAGDRVVVGVREIDLELVVEVVDRHRPVDAHRVVVDALDRSPRARRTRR